MIHVAISNYIAIINNPPAHGKRKILNGLLINEKKSFQVSWDMLIRKPDNPHPRKLPNQQETRFAS